MNAPREIHAPEIGLLQWWANSPWDRQHWYVDEQQVAYRVAIEYGRPGSIADEDGRLLANVAPELGDDLQEALL